MSRNFEESRRKSWKKLRQWGNATPFTIKHDTFILGTQNNLETNATLRSRSLYRKHEEKNGDNGDNQAGRSQSVAVTLEVHSSEQDTQPVKNGGIKSTKPNTSKVGQKQKDINHSEFNKISKIKRRGSKKVPINKSKTISEKTKNEDHTSIKNSNDEEINIISDKEEHRKGSVNVENIMIEENKILEKEIVKRVEIENVKHSGEKETLDDEALHKSQINETPISEEIKKKRNADREAMKTSEEQKIKDEINKSLKEEDSKKILEQDIIKIVEEGKTEVMLQELTNMAINSFEKEVKNWEAEGSNQQLGEQVKIKSDEGTRKILQEEYIKSDKDDTEILKEDKKIEEEKEDLNNSLEEKELEKSSANTENKLENGIKEKKEEAVNEMMDKEENNILEKEAMEYLDKEKNERQDDDTRNMHGDKGRNSFENEAKAKSEEELRKRPEEEANTISKEEIEKILLEEEDKVKKISENEDKNRLDGEPVEVEPYQNLEDKGKKEEMNILDEANRKEYISDTNMIENNIEKLEDYKTIEKEKSIKNEQPDKKDANLFIGILEDEHDNKIKHIIQNKEILSVDKSCLDELKTYEGEKTHINKSSKEEMEDVFITEITEIHEKLMEETPKLGRHQNMSLDEEVRITDNEEQIIRKEELMNEQKFSIGILNEESLDKNVLGVKTDDLTPNSVLTINDVENGESSEAITKVMGYLNFASHNTLINCQDLNGKDLIIVDICQSPPHKFNEEISHISISDDITNNFGKIADKICDLITAKSEVIVTCSGCLDLAATACIAYMLKYKRIKLTAALNFIKQQKPHITIDSEIMKKLEAWGNGLIHADVNSHKFIDDQRLITQVFSQLNLANFIALNDEDLNKFRITSVIEMSRDGADGDKDGADNSLTILSKDGVESFGDIADKIHMLVSAGGEVVVACDNGAAIAASACIAYLVKYQGINVDDAQEIIQQNRPALSMDPSIINQLINWEFNIKHENLTSNLEQGDILQICQQLNVAKYGVLHDNMLTKNTVTSVVEISSSPSIASSMDLQAVLFSDIIADDFGDIADSINNVFGDGGDGGQLVVTSEKSLDLAVSSCIAYLVKHHDQTVQQTLKNISKNNPKLSVEQDMVAKLLKWEQVLIQNSREIITEQKIESNITKIFDNLNIGNHASVNYEDKLKEHAINSVVEIASSPSNIKTTGMQTVLYENDITFNFDDVADKIDILINEGGNVAVTSNENVGLAYAACVAYLAKYEGYGVAQAIDIISQEKIKASLEPNTVEKLIKWEQVLLEKRKESKVTEIFSHLNVADYTTAINDKDSLAKKSITCVIEISSYPSVLSTADDIQSVLFSSDIPDNFNDVADKIDQLKKEGQNIAVMSNQNLDLAVSACVAYLVKYQGYGVTDAINIISKKNPHIGIAKTTIEKLQQWQILLEEKADEINSTDISNNLKAADFSGLDNLDAIIQNSGSYVLRISSSPTGLLSSDNHAVFFTNDITQNFGDIADKINALVVDRDNIMVVSEKGEFEAVSACIAYLVKYQDMSVDEAINTVEENRPTAIIDESTRGKLHQWKLSFNKDQDREILTEEDIPNVTAIFNNLNITTNNVLEDFTIFNNMHIDSLIELTSNPSLESKFTDCGLDVVSISKNILEDLDKVAYTIAQLVEAGGKVVVTCDENIGLAASACLAYLAIYEGMQVQNMALAIKQIRPDVRFQENVLESIKNWFHELKLQEEEEMAKKLVTEQVENKTQSEQKVLDKNITEIFSNLSMSSFEALQDAEWIKKQNISSVIELSSSCTFLNGRHPLAQGSLVISDHVIENFESIADKIDILTLAGENVLVVCDKGDELAACVCIAYLVKYQGLEVTQAIYNIIQKRPSLTINDDILNKLLNWAKLMKKVEITEVLNREKETVVTQLFNHLSIRNLNLTDIQRNQGPSLVSSNDVQVITVNGNIYKDFSVIADKINTLINSERDVVVVSDESADIAATACIAYAVKYQGMEVDEAVASIHHKTNHVNIHNHVISKLYNWKLNLDQEEKLIEICNNLNVASYAALKNAENLSNQDITAVVEISSFPSIQNTCQLKVVAVTNDVINDFGEVVDIINDLITDDSQVVVSCDKSTTIAIATCIAYLVKYKSLTVDEAVNIIKEKLSEINIDQDLLNKLKEWEYLLIEETAEQSYTRLAQREKENQEELKRKEDEEQRKKLATEEEIYQKEEEEKGQKKVLEVVETKEERRQTLDQEEAKKDEDRLQTLALIETERQEDKSKQNLDLEEAKRKEEERTITLALEEDAKEEKESKRNYAVEEERIQKLALEEANRQEEKRKQKVSLDEAETKEEERKQKLASEEANRMEEEIKEKLALLEAERKEEARKQKLALEETNRKEEENRQRLALEEAKRRDDERKQKLAQEEANRMEEEIKEKSALLETERKEEERKQKLVLEETKRKEEENRQRLALEEAKRRDEAKRQKLAQEEANRMEEVIKEKSALLEAERKEEERKLKLALEETKREEEEKRQKLALEETKRRDDERRQNMVREEAERKLEEEEKIRKWEAEESKRKYEEQECARKLAELEESRITKIFNNLSLSNYRALNDVEAMKKHGVNFVIEINNNPHPKTNIESLNVTIPDEISKNFGLIADTINNVICSGKYILVAGEKSCSASSAACIAYMIKYHGLRARKAALCIQEVRPNTIIDIRTISQLEDWQWKLRKQKIKQRFQSMIETIAGHYDPAYIPCMLTMIIIYIAFKMFQEKVEDEYRKFVKLPRDQNIDPYNFFDVKKWP